MNFNGCPYQNLFSLDLNVLREGASTTSHGNKFQAFTTLFENTFARTFSLDRFLNSLRPLLHCHIGYQMFRYFGNVHHVFFFSYMLLSFHNLVNAKMSNFCLILANKIHFYIMPIFCVMVRYIDL